MKSDQLFLTAVFFPVWEVGYYKKKTAKKIRILSGTTDFHGMSEGFLNAWMKEESVE